MRAPATSVGYKQTAQGRQRRRLFSGRGVDTDIVVASAKAYMQALNKALASKEDNASALNIAEGATKETV
jgi:2-isopropylmalate synthase